MQVVVVVTELTLGGARDGIRILSWLKSNAPHALVLLVANKVPSGVGEISRSDFETSIERKLNFVIPHDFKAAANAAKLGQTFVGANRASKTVQPLRAIADAIVASDGERDAPAMAKPAKGLGKSAKAAQASGDGDTDKGSGSVLSRSIKKLLSSKSKTGVPA
jgi:pilus assembly protein CpaE